MGDQKNLALNVDYPYSSVAEWIDLEKLGVLIVVETLRMLQEKNYLPDLSGIF